MECGSARLTVYFDGPFWVGVYEREQDGRLEVCRHVFGGAPREGDVYQWLLSHWRGLAFSPAVESRRPAVRRNPKRARRQARRETDRPGVGTKAQQALQLQQEQWKAEGNRRRRQRDAAEEERRFRLHQEKKKEKRRGH